MNNERINKEEKEDPKAQLRKRILVSSIKAFRENGIKSITMDDIANRLGISKRTLYEVFSDKEELLIQCILYQQAESLEYFKEIFEKADNVMEVVLKFYEKSLEIYHKTNRRFFEDMHKYPRVQEMSKDHHEKNVKNVVDFFKIGVEQGIFRKDVNYEVMHLLVREQVLILVNTDIFNQYAFYEVYESIMIVFMRGIATEKGQQILEKFIQEYRLKNKKD